MSLRFIVAVGSPDGLSSYSARIRDDLGLAINFASDRCLVLSNVEDSVHLLPDDGGAILGTLYHRHGYPEPIGELDRTDGQSALSTVGVHLIERFWGSYLAILDMAGGVQIVRDPSGTLPCCYMEAGGVVVLASDADYLGLIVDKRLSKDERGLAQALYFPGLPGTRTALSSVRDLLPGSAITIDAEGTRTRWLWNPWAFVEPDDDLTFDEHALRLRRIAQACIAAVGRRYHQGLVGVSGGLDSSIVASVLAASGNGPSGITMVTEDPLGDERVYAQALTQHLGVTLVSRDYALSDVRIDRSVVWHRPRPYGRCEALAYDAVTQRVAAELGAGAIFTGNGGDNLFYLSYSARGVADRFLWEGLSRGLLQTVRDVSRLTGASVGRVLVHAMRAVRLAKKPYAWKGDATFLSPQIVGEFEETPVSHDWLTPPGDVRLPGKAAHIAMLLRMQHSVEAQDRTQAVPMIHPLVSQPLMETCLAIPTWEQCRGGVNRAVARSAFERDLPANLVARRGKGSPNGFGYEIIEHFRPMVRERLLDGHLSSAGLLDRAALEQALAPDALNSSSAITRLLFLIDSEAWAEHWSARPS